MKKENAYQDLKYFKKELILGPTFKMLEVFFELLMPFLMSYIIDKGIPEAQQYNDFSKIYIPGLTIVGLAILGLCSTMVCQYIASITSQGFGTKLRNRIYEKVMNLSLNQIEEIGKGNLNTLISNDVNRLQVSVAMMVRLVLRAPTLVIGSLVCSFIINWKVGLVFLSVVILISIVLFIIIKKSSKKIVEIQKETDEIVTLANDDLKGIRVIKAFNNEEKEINKFKEKTNNFYSKTKVINLINAFTNPLISLIINSAICVVIYFSSNEILVNLTMTKGDLTSLIQYLNQILLALIVVSNLIIIFTRAFASKARIDVLLNLDPSIKNNPKVLRKEIKKGETLFSFDNVSFKYNGTQNNVVSNLTFDIKKGETIGIIGGTGSGKTTIIKLFERFIERSEGTILYKNVDIKDYDLNNLHNELSLVSQKAVLFKGTIRSNFEMANPNASEEDIKNALMNACAYDFVSKYSDYIDHKVEEDGKNFSGGQRQRLSIARSFCKNAETIILDDSTSALDYLTEKNLKQNIKNMQNKTIILIAQRVSSIKHADKIIVMNHGEIDAIGNHEELLKTSLVYKEIYNSQYGDNQDE